MQDEVRKRKEATQRLPLSHRHRSIQRPRPTAASGAHTLRLEWSRDKQTGRGTHHDANTYIRLGTATNFGMPVARTLAQLNTGIMRAAASAGEHSRGAASLSTATLPSIHRSGSCVMLSPRTICNSVSYGLQVGSMPKPCCRTAAYAHCNADIMMRALSGPCQRAEQLSDVHTEFRRISGLKLAWCRS
jgi:hypothetical protein